MSFGTYRGWHCWTITSSQLPFAASSTTPSALVTLPASETSQIDASLPPPSKAKSHLPSFSSSSAAVPKIAVSPLFYIPNKMIKPEYESADDISGSKLTPNPSLLKSDGENVLAIFASLSKLPPKKTNVTPAPNRRRQQHQRRKEKGRKKGGRKQRIRSYVDLGHRIHAGFVCRLSPAIAFNCGATRDRTEAGQICPVQSNSHVSFIFPSGGNYGQQSCNVQHRLVVRPGLYPSELI